MQSLIGIIVLAYMGACLYLYFGQRSFLYFPTPETNPPNAEKILLKSDGETIRIWKVGNGEDAVIYFGGNGEEVSHNIPLLPATLAGRSLYLVNYRGYGGSTGSPSEAGLFQDAVAVFDAVRAKHANISVIGRSLGSGVAVYLASVKDVKKLVLITPYDSVENVAKKQFPIFPISFLLRDKFTSSARAKDVKAPVLIVVAERDEVIPRENTDALIASFPASQGIVEVVPGATHNSIGTSEQYLDRLRSFL
jgi:fermentation-respiration switch protein FrsA (DUF1100 family)